jgi:hypothetical protein
VPFGEEIRLISRLAALCGKLSAFKITPSTIVSQFYWNLQKPEKKERIWLARARTVLKIMLATGISSDFKKLPHPLKMGTEIKLATEIGEDNLC